jgi:hydrogenase-4 component B
MAGVAGIVSLALIGGLAAACFTKVFGIVFLGEPRTKTAGAPGDVPAPMVWAMALLAIFCIIVGMGSPFILTFLIRPALLLAGPAAGAATDSITSLTMTVSIVLCSFVITAAFVAGLVKVFLRKGRPVTTAVTWDCGYSRPEPSMQYTASSFAAPIIDHFKIPLAAHKKLLSDGKLFPGIAWSFHSEVEDWFLTRVYSPALEFFDRLFASLRWFQNGKAGQYVLYIAITLFCLIVWKFFL